MDYSLQLTSQLQQLLKSLRKSRKMTQHELAQRLGVVQSRVADIERNPGAVSVEQLLQVLAMLGAQLVVRDTTVEIPATKPSLGLEGHARAKVTATGLLTTSPKPAMPTSEMQPDGPDDVEPRGQW